MTIKYWNVEVSLSFVTTTNLKYFIRPSKSCCKSSLRATLRMAKATRNMVSMPCKRKTSRTRKTCCWRNQKVFILQDKIYANFTDGGCHLRSDTGVTLILASDHSKTKRKWLIDKNQINSALKYKLFALSLFFNWFIKYNNSQHHLHFWSNPLTVLIRIQRKFQRQQQSWNFLRNGCSIDWAVISN